MRLRFTRWAWRLGGSRRARRLLALAAVLAACAAPLARALPAWAEESPFANHIISGSEPDGTTIDLFDYWLTDRHAQDWATANLAGYQGQGINAGHSLRFIYRTEAGTGVNSWHGGGPYQGMLQPTLDADGYPRLASSLGGASLAYLFDGSDEASGTQAGKAVYPDVHGLLHVDSEGYYAYDARENFAAFDEDAHAFNVYDTWAVKASPRLSSNHDGQFFPFDAPETVLEEGGQGLVQRGATPTSTDLDPATTNSGTLNHWFGMSMTSHFVQQDGGTTHGGPMTYEFTGDDDMWVFIDGVLVADLGGIHGARSIAIDFQTGRVDVFEDRNGDGTRQGGERAYSSKTLLDCYRAADREGETSWSGNTFADGTLHTLKFFYLERGSGASNMKLRFNMASVPESSLLKLDQDGQPVAGASFALFPTGADHAIAEGAAPVYMGTTGDDGTMRVVDNSGAPASLDGMRVRSPYWVLRETETPSGYRSAGDIPLAFDTEVTSTPLLVSTDPWGTGAIARPKVLMAADDIGVYDEAGTRLTTEAGTLAQGRLFAVVMRRGGDGTWHAVTGGALDGWQEAEAPGTAGAVAAAAAGEAEPLSLNGSGVYEISFAEVPGDIKSYEQLMRENPALGDAAGARYRIGCFYTTADDLAQATAGNTRPVRDVAGDFTCRLATTFYASNVRNELVVQKVDDGGAPLAGAGFSLFAAADVEQGEDGSLAVREGAQPVASVVTGEVAAGAAGRAGDETLEGAAVIGAPGTAPLEEGRYYLVETAAPEGYELNGTLVPVAVDGSGVYADAGTAKDGVSVARGVGQLAGSMRPLAFDDGAGATLGGVRAAMVTSGGYEGEATDWGDPAWDGASSLELRCSAAGPAAPCGYLPVKGAADLVTDTGWSKLVIEREGTGVSDADGSASRQDPGTRDLSAIFSGTVTVRVADRRLVPDEPPAPDEPPVPVEPPATDRPTDPGTPAAPPATRAAQGHTPLPGTGDDLPLVLVTLGSLGIVAVGFGLLARRLRRMRDGR